MNSGYTCAHKQRRGNIHVRLAACVVHSGVPNRWMHMAAHGPMHIISRVPAETLASPTSTATIATYGKIRHGSCL